MVESRALPCVVLADDDPDDCLLMCDAFSEAGVQVELHTLQDGEMLLDFLLCREGQTGCVTGALPVLVVCDINMPRLSGLEAVRQLRAEDRLASVPVVMMTSSRREEDRQRSFDCGASGHYVKPSSYREMVDMVREIMARFVSRAA